MRGFSFLKNIYLFDSFPVQQRNNQNVSSPVLFSMQLRHLSFSKWCMNTLQKNRLSKCEKLRSIEMLHTYFWRTLVMCDFKNKLFSVKLPLPAGFEACLSGGGKSEGTFWLMDNTGVAEKIEMQTFVWSWRVSKKGVTLKDRITFLLSDCENYCCPCSFSFSLFVSLNIIIRRDAATLLSLSFLRQAPSPQRFSFEADFEFQSFWTLKCAQSKTKQFSFWWWQFVTKYVQEKENKIIFKLISFFFLFF